MVDLKHCARHSHWFSTEDPHVSRSGFGRYALSEDGLQPMCRRCKTEDDAETNPDRVYDWVDGRRVYTGMMKDGVFQPVGSTRALPKARAPKPAVNDGLRRARYKGRVVIVIEGNRVYYEGQTADDAFYPGLANLKF